MADNYEFTTDWFSRFASVWTELLKRFPPSRILEIGSYEGRAACFLIQTCAAERDIELHCIDTWEGGVEHDTDAMPLVEQRFDRNIAIARDGAPHAVNFHKHKSLSSAALVKLLAEERHESFDLIYVDGSHQAPDVLSDAVLAFMLLRPGGLLVFDDYLWSMDGAGKQDFYQLPKPAIDAFVNIYQRKISVVGAPLYQLYIRKLSS
ncbi:MAG TPA: class I SAM-dependent methyltransferase [Phenylobacterium sp.]|uniref:class I SAM-dependent methyltransferase n=1 Tax=Phenylobacterium sp. TaxID=1871053 RepID=UPI002B4A1A83|nr:class I SAM-dependent methyltransferase [Phenylobacterium sp.]HKR88329.1 class I SAM-dependent methyltransferase [Phenylobacterium sp.]